VTVVARRRRRVGVRRSLLRDVRLRAQALTVLAVVRVSGVVRAALEARDIGVALTAVPVRVRRVGQVLVADVVVGERANAGGAVGLGGRGGARVRADLGDGDGVLGERRPAKDGVGVVPRAAGLNVAVVEAEVDPDAVAVGVNAGPLSARQHLVHLLVLVAARLAVQHDVLVVLATVVASVGAQTQRHGRARLVPLRAIAARLLRRAAKLGRRRGKVVDDDRAVVLEREALEERALGRRNGDEAELGNAHLDRLAVEARRHAGRGVQRAVERVTGVELAHVRVARRARVARRGRGEARAAVAVAHAANVVGRRAECHTAAVGARLAVAAANVAGVVHERAKRRRVAVAAREAVAGADVARVVAVGAKRQCPGSRGTRSRRRRTRCTASIRDVPHGTPRQSRPPAPPQMSHSS
jgi:hypothetical protein